MSPPTNERAPSRETGGAEDGTVNPTILTRRRCAGELCWCHGGQYGRRSEQPTWPDPSDHYRYMAELLGWIKALSARSGVAS
jgi:hypothetical protein